MTTSLAPGTPVFLRCGGVWDTSEISIIIEPLGHDDYLIRNKNIHLLRWKRSDLCPTERYAALCLAL